MSVGSLLLALWLILVGVVWVGWISIDIKILGVLAFVTGIIWLVEGAGVAPWRKQ